MLLDLTPACFKPADVWLMAFLSEVRTLLPVGIVNSVPTLQAAAAAAASVEEVQMQLRITFPSLYPSAAPSFHFNANGKQQLVKSQNRVKEELNRLTERLVEQKQNCLLHGIRPLLVLCSRRAFFDSPRC
jgi:hypothetical protein